MTSKRNIKNRIEELEDRIDDDAEEDTVLVIGGDADRAGVMTEERYREEYTEEERAGHVECGPGDDREDPGETETTLREVEL